MIGEDSHCWIYQYEFRKKIGSGSYASVYKAVHQLTQLTVIIKIINKDLLDTVKKKIILVKRSKS
jgi:serine/threonine protein kinase